MITPINPSMSATLGAYFGPGVNSFAGVAPVSTPPATGMTGTEALGAAALVMGVFGAINGAIGSFYQAQSAQNEMKMQAQNLRFQGQIAAVNARGAEFSAQQTMLAGERAIGQYTMQAGQQKGSAKAAMAARGIQAGVGSAKEVVGSMDLIKEIDVLTMNANSVRQAEALRTQRVNYINQSVMAGTSADNMMASARTISPWTGMSTSLMNSAASIGGEWARNMRMDELIAANSSVRF